MKKITFLLLTATSLIHCMEDSPAVQITFEQLPQEVQSDILSFLPEATRFNSHTRAQEVNSQFRALVTDQAFMNSYAERLAQYNMQVAEELLRRAATHGKFWLAAALLKAGVDPDCFGTSHFDHEFSISLLNSTGIVPSNVMLDGKNHNDTPLLNALNNNHIAIAELLMSYKATINCHIREYKLLTILAARGKLAGVKFLLDHGVNMDTQDPHGETALWWAMHSNQSATARLLLERGADPNLAGGDISATPLMFAANRGDDALVELILSKGAEINAKDIYETTALEYAQLSKRATTAKLLIEHGGLRFTERDEEDSEED